MVILGIESAAGAAGAAIIDGGRLKSEVYIDNKMTHSQTLLGAVERVMENAGITDPASAIDGIAVSKGPGSFTGLRIGSSMAKGLAYAWNKPILAVPTIDAMALMLSCCGGLVCPVMDARRDQVFTGIYSFSKTAEGGFPLTVGLGDGVYMNVLNPEEPLAVEELAARLDTYGLPVTFLGDAASMHGDRLRRVLGERACFMDQRMGNSRAAAVAWLGELYMENGATEDAFTHVPEYMRMSQAERVRLERENKENV